MPESLSPASASTVAVSGATIIESPIEKTQERRQQLRPVVDLPAEPDEREQRRPRRSSGPTPMKRRGPKRIDSRPTRGERKNMTIVIGMRAKPLFSAEYPAICCR